MSIDEEEIAQIDEIRQLLLKPDVLVDKISPVIADILEEHIVNSRDEMAQAIAPVIGEAIRHQVHQARDDIVDALYPVIGRTVNKAITEAVRDLARTVDTRIRQNMVRQNVSRRLKARFKGVSEAEYRLRELLPFAIREVFLIQRNSGLLICHYSYGKVLPDRDLVSGMLTAVRDFARDVFGQSEQGELGTIAYEDQNILLEASGAVYIAAVIEGVEPSGFREELRHLLVALHEQYYERLKHFDGSDTEVISSVEQALVAALPDPYVAPESSRRTLSSFQRFVLVTLALLLIGPPILLCVGWVWRVENQMAALAAVPATATVTATMTPEPTPTLVASATPTPAPTATPAPTPTPEPRFGVMIGNVYLRGDPLQDSTRTNLVAPLGARVEVLAQDGDWYNVRVAVTEQSEVEMTGWVPVRWVRLFEE